MVDVLRLLAGKLVTESDPLDWTYLTSGKIVETSTGLQSNSLQLSGGRRIGVTGPASPPTVVCVDLLLCTQSGSPGCDTISGCGSNGEAHRVEWDVDDCNDSSHHIRVRANENSTGWYTVETDLSCTQADNDDGCCEVGGTCTPDGTRVWFLERTTVSSTTTDWEYEVRVERDSDDFVFDSGSDSCTDCGGDDTCIS